MPTRPRYRHDQEQNFKSASLLPPRPAKEPLEYSSIHSATSPTKPSKKNGEFVLPGFGKLVKQKRKVRSGFNPKTQRKIKIPAKTVVKFRVAKAAEDAVLGSRSSLGV